MSSKFRSEASSQVQAAPSTNAVYEKNPLNAHSATSKSPAPANRRDRFLSPVSRRRFSERITPCHRDAQ